MIICIPGPWNDRSEFLQKVVTDTQGEFLVAGGILANPKSQDHVPLEFCELYPEMRRAFEIAGQGKLPDFALDQIADHKSVLSLTFPLTIFAQRERVLRFTSLMKDVGSYAI